MAYRELDLLPARAFRARFGRLETLEGGGKDAPAAPDYTPMATASKEAAEIGAQLGREQLAENRRQYEQNMAVAKPVVDRQSALMDQTKAQGDDYFNYMKEYRPLERTMLAEVSGLTPADMQRFSSMRRGIEDNARNAWSTDLAGRKAALQAQIDQALAEEAKAAEAAKATAAQQPGRYLSPSGQVYENTNLKAQDYAPGYMDAGGEQGMVADYGQLKSAAQAAGLDTTAFDNPFGGASSVTADKTLQQLKEAGYEYYGPGAGFLKAAGSAPASASPSGTPAAPLRSVQLQSELAKLGAEKFNPATVDYGALQDEQTLRTMDGRKAKEALDQAERDQILSLADIRNQETQDQADRDTLMLGRGQLYEKDKANIDDQVGTAVADSRAGYTQALGQIARQGLRYGLSPEALASQSGALGLQSASQTASAANTTRNAGIDDYRTRVAGNRDMRQADFLKNYGLKKSTRDMRIQDESLSWAKSLDVAGLAKGMPGASQGAYSLANQSGNSAVSNMMAPSQALMTGIAQGNSTIMQGQGQKVQGLGSVLNSQTSAYNSGQGGESFGSILGGIGGLAAGAAKIAPLFMASDRRLKENIVTAGYGPHGLTLYEFNYIGHDQRYRGVMADEVEQVMPEAVSVGEGGFKQVNYGMLGMQMVEV